MRVMHKPLYGNRLCLLDGTYNVYWWPNTIFRVEFDVSCLSLHNGLVRIATAYMMELRRCFLFSSSFLSFSWTLKNVKPLQKIKSVLIVKFIIFGPYFFNYIELFSIWSFGFWFLYKICHFILWCYMFNPQYFDF